MDFLKSLYLFGASLISKTAAYITGGVVSAGITLYERYTGKNIPLNWFIWFVAAFFVTACFLSWRDEYKRNLDLKIVHRDALTLPSMRITAVAEHILNNSEWAWKARLRLTLKSIVKDLVAAEMRRAGTDYQVRYIGALPNSNVTMEIDRIYWQSATLDDARIWDERNEFFTTTFGISHAMLPHYRFGSAPKVDVERTWPSASNFLKVSVMSIIWCRKARQGFPKWLQDSEN